MKLLERLIPSSITTQLTGLVTVSVVLGIAFTITIFFLLYNPEIPKDSPPLVAARIANIAHLAQVAQTLEEREAIVSAAMASGLLVSKVARPTLQQRPEAQSLPFMVNLTKRQLQRYHHIDIIEQAWYPPGPRYQLAIALDDGSALVFDVTLGSSIWRYILTPAALALVIVLIFLLLISIYAVRWVTAPLAAVAKATLSFGRSPQDDQVVVRRGPREIAQVADALNDMRSRIRALLDDRTRMLTAISHDLRTPLTRLRLRAERVGDDDLREAMLGDLERVSRMLAETLDYLRGTGRLEECSLVDLPSLLQTICSDFADVGHDVSYQGPARLAWMCRPSALSRALTNVVENGLKHGGAVIVDLKAHDSVAEIEISDNGPGIPRSLRDKVFEPFFKADDSRGTGEGFGLGLPLARDIVQGHGGEISLLDRIPIGLTVRIVLPTPDTRSPRQIIP